MRSTADQIKMPPAPTIAVTRTDTVVTAFHAESGKVDRSEMCRNIQCAVALETKLRADHQFADRWAYDKDSILPVSTPHGGERQPQKTSPNALQSVLDAPL